MENLIVLIHIFIVSLILGLIKFKTIDTSGKNWQAKFAEIWNDTTNFLVSGLIGFYFVTIKWPLLLKGNDLNIFDIVLLVIFLLGMFGHLCVLSYLLTEGIKDIIKKKIEG